jgi:hypothetical protein
LNPSNEASLASFKTTLKKWVKNIALEGIAIESFFFYTHYMNDMVIDMAELLDVINKIKSSSFL